MKKISHEVLTYDFSDNSRPQKPPGQFLKAAKRVLGELFYFYVVRTPPSIIFLVLFLWLLRSEMTNSFNAAFAGIPLAFLLISSLSKSLNGYLINCTKPNTLNVKCWDNDCFIEKPSHGVQLWDIVLLKKAETVPSDMVLLAHSHEASQCLVEETQIAATTKLNQKRPIEDTHKIFNEAEADTVSLWMKLLTGYLRVLEMGPSSFSGEFKMPNSPISTKLDDTYIAFAGSQIHEPDWVLGLVIENWKTFQLSKFRTSHIEKILRSFSCTLILVCGSLSVLNYGLSQDGSGTGFLHFLTLYSSIVPSSVFFILALARTLNKFWINKAETNLVVNNSEALEDLSTIDYVFIEKNSLTEENSLKVEDIVVGWNRIEFPESNIDYFINKTEEFEIAELEEVDPALKTHFLVSLLVCSKLRPDSEGTIKGWTQEDKVLLETAKLLGVFIEVYNSEMICLLYKGRLHIFKLLAFLSFESDDNSRVMLKNKRTKEIMLYVRGSKSSMLPLLPSNVADKLSPKLAAIGVNGKRPLIFGFKTFKKEHFIKFMNSIKASQRASINRKEKFKAIVQKLEKNLQYTGFVSVQSSIKHNTVCSVKTFINLGSKVWVLSEENEESSSCLSIELGFRDLACKSLVFKNIENKYDLKILLKKAYETQNNMSQRKLKKRSVLPQTVIKKFPLEQSQRRRMSRSLARPSTKLKKIDEEVDLDENYQFVFKSNTIYQNFEFGNSIDTKSVTSFMNKVNEYSAPNETKDEVSLSGTTFKNGIIIEDLAIEIASSSLKCFDALLALLLRCRYTVIYGIKPFTSKILSKVFTQKLKMRTLNIGKSLQWYEHMSWADLNIRIGVSTQVCDINADEIGSVNDLVLDHCLGISFSFSNIVCVEVFKNAFLAGLLGYYQFYCDFSGGLPVTQWDLFFCGHVVLVCPFLAEGLFYQSKCASKGYLEWKMVIFYSLLGFLHSILVGVFHLSLCTSILNSDGVSSNSGALELSTFVTCLLNLQITCYWLLKKSVQSYLGHFVSFALWILYITFRSDSWETFSESPKLILTSLLSPGLCLILTFLLARFKDLVTQSICKSILMRRKIRKFNKRVWKTSKSIKGYFKKLASLSDRRFEMNALTLKFKSLVAELEYLHETPYIFIQKCKFILGIGTFFCLVYIFMYLGSSLDYFRIGAISCLLLIFIYMSIYSLGEKFRRKPMNSLIILNYIIQGFQVAYLLFSEPTQAEFNLLISAYFYFGLETTFYLTLITNFPRSVLEVIQITQFYYYYYEEPSKYLPLFLVKFLAIEITSVIKLYLIEKRKRADFQTRQEIYSGVKKARSVLSYALPAFVRRRVKEGTRYIAENIENVTIVFCNIMHFGEILQSYSPQELTMVLDLVFRKFDEICEKTGMTKVETVGYTYMACAGLNDGEDELSSNKSEVPQSRRSVEMAIAMSHACENIVLMTGKQLEVKIGIHSGPVVAGVVGGVKPQFSLVGDTVNTASRMASTAAGVIQISETTFSLLQNTDDLELSPMVIYAKGKGYVNTFDLRVNQNCSLDQKIIHDHSSIRNILTSDWAFDTKYTKNNLLQNKSLKKTEKEVELFETPEERKASKVFCNSESVSGLDKGKFSAFALAVYIVSEFSFVAIWVFKSVYHNSADFLPNILIDLSCISIVIFAVLLEKKSKGWKWFGWVLQGCYLLILVLTSLHIYFSAYMTSEVWNICMLHVLLISSLGSQLPFKHLLWTNLLKAIVYFSQLLFLGEVAYYSSIILIFYLVIIIYSVYHQEKLLLIFNFRCQKALTEQEKIDNLLTSIMPEEAYSNLKEENAFVDTFENLTLIYADIVGFTSWSSGRQPIEVIEMLSHLFDRFDQACKDYGVYKVHTIGDCYVVMSASSNEQRKPSEECFNMLKFAERMIEIIRGVNSEYQLQLDMRIGMHTGTVVGGIAGTTIVRYDIYGEDVIIANQMESHGVPGKICISQKTKETLENFHSFFIETEFFQEVELPSVNRIVATYFANTRVLFD